MTFKYMVVFTEHYNDNTALRQVKFYDRPSAERYYDFIMRMKETYNDMITDLKIVNYEE